MIRNNNRFYAPLKEKKIVSKDDLNCIFCNFFGESLLHSQKLFFFLTLLFEDLVISAKKLHLRVDRAIENEVKISLFFSFSPSLSLFPQFSDFLKNLFPNPGYFCFLVVAVVVIVAAVVTAFFFFFFFFFDPSLQEKKKQSKKTPSFVATPQMKKSNFVFMFVFFSFLSPVSVILPLSIQYPFLFSLLSLFPTSSYPLVGGDWNDVSTNKR